MTLPVVQATSIPHGPLQVLVDRWCAHLPNDRAAQWWHRSGDPTAVNSRPQRQLDPPTQRDRHLAIITEHGRLAWQVATGYGQRSLVETTMGRHKTLIGPRLRTRAFAAQQTEAAIGVTVLNRMLAAGRRIPSVANRSSDSRFGLVSSRPEPAEYTNAALLHTLQDPRVNIAGIRRADLLALVDQLSPARFSRQLRRLRDIGVIKRVTGNYRLS